MIIVDNPYLSNFLKETITSSGIAVLDTLVSKKFGIDPASKIIDENSAITKFKDDPNFRLYTTSENALGWVVDKLADTKLPNWINLFKNKVKFRQLISNLYPDFMFKEILFKDLKNFDINAMSFPFILKPSVGFFSLGVKKIDSAEQWLAILDQIEKEMLEAVKHFPKQVLNASNFILEQYIEGDEYAVDAYFDQNGEAVILGIYQHVFSSSSDVSDRMYLTSRKIIQDNIDDFSEILKQISTLTSIRNFPLHIEVRKDSEGTVIPIEVNPLRFGGWCTTADLTHHAFDFNPYEYYFNNIKPDWDKILTDKEDIYSIIILDNSTGLKANQIASFDYDQLLKQFEKTLELREIDYHKFPLFGFLFTQTKPANFAELDKILKSDLLEFIQQV